MTAPSAASRWELQRSQRHLRRLRRALELAQFQRALAAATALAQLGVLALNAISRQIVQNLELRPVLDVASAQVKAQWSPIIVFLLIFVGALGVVAWMISRVLAAGREPVPA